MEYLAQGKLARVSGGVGREGSRFMLPRDRFPAVLALSCHFEVVWKSPRAVRVLHVAPVVYSNKNSGTPRGRDDT